MYVNFFWFSKLINFVFLYSIFKTWTRDNFIQKIYRKLLFFRIFLFLKIINLSYHKNLLYPFDYFIIIIFLFFLLSQFYIFYIVQFLSLYSFWRETNFEVNQTFFFMQWKKLSLSVSQHFRWYFPLSFYFYFLLMQFILFIKIFKIQSN